MDYTLTQKQTDEGFDFWKNKDFLSEETKKELENVSILILPLVDFRENIGPTFPLSTEHLFKFFSEKLPEGTSIEVCIDEEDYTEVALHSDLKNIGKFLVKDIALPIFLTILTAYMESKFKDKEDNGPDITIINQISAPEIKPAQRPRNPKKYQQNPNVKVEFTVVDSSGKSIGYKYEGSAKDFPLITRELKSLMSNDTTGR